jgi:hypothetical protein
MRIHGDMLRRSPASRGAPWLALGVAALAVGVGAGRAAGEGGPAVGRGIGLIPGRPIVPVLAP